MPRLSYSHVDSSFCSHQSSSNYSWLRSEILSLVLVGQVLPPLQFGNTLFRAEDARHQINLSDKADYYVCNSLAMLLLMTKGRIWLATPFFFFFGLHWYCRLLHCYASVTWIHLRQCYSGFFDIMMSFSPIKMNRLLLLLLQMSNSCHRRYQFLWFGTHSDFCLRASLSVRFHLRNWNYFCDAQLASHRIVLSCTIHPKTSDICDSKCLPRPTLWFGTMGTQTRCLRWFRESKLSFWQRKKVLSISS